MKERFYSLDVFRGATVAFMILVNNAGNWEHIYTPLEHAPWHGLTFTDLVFPFFLFAVGNAMAMVMPRLQEGGQAVFLKKVISRTLWIFGIGLFLNWFPFISWQGDSLKFRHWVNPDDPEHGVRILGVLQRIALCYLFASLIVYYFKIRGAFFAAALLLLGYWVLCLAFGNPADPFSIQGYFGNRIDQAVLGIPHLYRGEGVPFDPEGIASTLSSIVEVLLGYFVGDYIRVKGKTYEMLSRLFVTGCVLVFVGYCWDMVFPINKKIWTSSFTVYTAGLATLLLCVLMEFVEFRNYRGAWTKVFGAFGKNPLFIYVLSGLIPRLTGLIRFQDGVDQTGHPIYTNPMGWFYEHICRPVSSNLNNGSLLYALSLVVVCALVAYWMDKRKIYIRV
jgi:predicted acyltransferase